MKLDNSPTQTETGVELPHPDCRDLIMLEHPEARGCEFAASAPRPRFSGRPVRCGGQTDENVS